MDPEESPPTAPHPNQRRLACERCRRQKLRCSRQNPSENGRCHRCIRLGFECVEGRQRKIGRPSRREASSGSSTSPGETTTMSSNNQSLINNESPLESPPSSNLKFSSSTNPAQTADMGSSFDFSNMDFSSTAGYGKTDTQTTSRSTDTICRDTCYDTRQGAPLVNLGTQSEAFQSSGTETLASSSTDYGMRKTPITGSSGPSSGQTMAVDPLLEASLLEFDDCSGFMGNWGVALGEVYRRRMQQQSQAEEQQRQQRYQEQELQQLQQQEVTRQCQNRQQAETDAQIQAFRQQHDRRQQSQPISSQYFSNFPYNSSAFNQLDAHALPPFFANRYINNKVKSLVAVPVPPPLPLEIGHGDAEILKKMSSVSHTLSVCLSVIDTHKHELEMDMLISIQSPLSANNLNMVERGIISIQDFLSNLVRLQRVLYGGFDSGTTGMMFMDENIGKIPLHQPNHKLNPILARIQHAVYEASVLSPSPRDSKSTNTSRGGSGCNDDGSNATKIRKKSLNSAMAMIIISCYSQTMTYLEILLYHVEYAVRNIGNKPLCGVPNLKFGAIPLCDAVLQGTIFTQLVGHLLDRIDQLVGVPLEDPATRAPNSSFTGDNGKSLSEGLLNEKQLKILWLELGSTHPNWSTRSQALKQELVKIRTYLNSMALI